MTTTQQKTLLTNLFEGRTTRQNLYEARQADEAATREAAFKAQRGQAEKAKAAAFLGIADDFVVADLTTNQVNSLFDDFLFPKANPDAVSVTRPTASLSSFFAGTMERESLEREYRRLVAGQVQKNKAAATLGIDPDFDVATLTEEQLTTLFEDGFLLPFVW